MTTTIRPAMPVKDPPPGGTPAAHTWRKGFRHWRDTSAASWLFTLPVIVLLVVLLIYPLIQSIFWSFTDFDGYSREYGFVGLENYGRVFTDASLLAGLTFTLMYTVGHTALVTVLAIPLALVLNRRFFGRNFVRVVFFFPSVPSLALIALVWGFILNPLGSGALNSVLDTLFGIGPFPWLSEATLARISVIAVSVWSATGWHAILYLAYLQSIPADLYEVARIDGANARQQFFAITLPLLTPAVTVSTLLLMTGGLKVYELPFVLTNGGPATATWTITQSIIVGGVGQGRYGLASALSTVFMLAVAAVVLAQLWASRRMERNVL